MRFRPTPRIRNSCRSMREWRSVCYCLVELSHNLFDVAAWQHYRQSGYESFEAYCTEVLHISAEQAEWLKLIRERSLPHRAKKGPGPFFAWLFQAAEILASAKKNDYR